MYFLINIAIIVGITIVFLSISRLIMNQFTEGKIGYRNAYRVLWLSTFIIYVTITVCVTLMALHIAVWLGVVVGLLTFIGIFLDPNRSISKDIKHSLEVARNRR